MNKVKMLAALTLSDLESRINTEVTGEIVNISLSQNNHKQYIACVIFKEVEINEDDLLKTIYVDELKISHLNHHLSNAVKICTVIDGKSYCIEGLVTDNDLTLREKLYVELSKTFIVKGSRNG